MFLRRFARPSSILMAMPKPQLTSHTMIAGHEAPRNVLINLYDKTLKEIELIPEDEGYRKAIEAATRQRLAILNEEEDVEKIVKRIGGGEMEELIEEANDELKVICHMLEWDPWGVNEDYIYVDDYIPKQVPKTEPSPLPHDFFDTLESLVQFDPKKYEEESRMSDE